jgi:predicted ABC-type ATPase
VPVLTLIAGPNGSGKSTFCSGVEFDGRERLIDADAIARVLNATDPARSAIDAGRETLRRIEGCLDSRLDFAVETTLSGRRQAELIAGAKAGVADMGRGVSLARFVGLTRFQISNLTLEFSERHADYAGGVDSAS